MTQRHIGERGLSVAAFSCLFAYLLSFLFEGRALYGLLEAGGVDASPYVLLAMLAHFLGLFTGGFWCGSQRRARTVALLGMGLCLLLTVPFFFALSPLWLLLLPVCGYAAGCAVAAWGYFLCAYTKKNERIRSCADMLIYSNLLMIASNVLTARLSARAGLALSVLCLAAGLVLTARMPAEGIAARAAVGPVSDLRRPMGILFLFVAVITVDSGLMYQVINPAFAHLSGLVSWYWAIPYIAALVFMKNLSPKNRMQRAPFLYVGMGLIMAAFVGFMLLGRNAADYLLVDTLMLAACGIFDLFWWSIIAETLDGTKNPAVLFGVGLSANVFGVLLGDLIGVGVTAARLPSAQVAVIALCVVCVTLILLPPLNRQLTLLLKSHAYLFAYAALPENAQRAAVAAVAPLDPLTERETEILRLLLEGRGNREIAAAGGVSENTVKTHLKSIYSKYAVASRAELISLLLRGRDC